MRPVGPGFLTLAALMGLLAALMSWTQAPPEPRGPVGEPVTTLWVLDNGFHTDLALPRDALDDGDGPLARAVRSLPPGEWIIVGWGDAVFYVDQSPISDRIPDGARAFFRPGNPSVVMLDPKTGDPSDAYGPDQRRVIQLDRAALTGVIARLERSLDAPDGQPRLAAQRAGDDARFFASTETFSVLHLCNHWTAEVLNAAGLTVRPFQSLRSVENLRAVDREAVAPRAASQG